MKEQAEIQHSKKYLIAKFVSRIFDVPIAGILTLFIVWSNAPSNDQISARAFFFVSLMSLLVIVLMVILFIRIGIVDNWEMTNRVSRKYVYLTVFLILCFLSILLLIFDVSDYYIKSLGLAFVIVTLYGLITNFTKFKLSLHVGFWTLTSILLTYYYGSIYLIAFAFLPIIAWARYTIKNHTKSEMILGFLLMMILVTTYLQFL